ncbi:MAG: hypothetical protein ABW321_11265 [Polyangiales bacterium]
MSDHPSRRFAQRWLISGLCLNLCIAACGGDDSARTDVHGPTKRDASTDSDASKPDAGPDASQPLVDGSMPLDSGLDATVDGNVGPGPGPGDQDGGDDNDGGPGSTEVCQVASEQSELNQPIGDAFIDEGGFSITPAVTGFALAYRTDKTCAAIGLLPISGSGKYGTPERLFDNCAAGLVQDVSLLRAGEGFGLAWIDNTALSRELQTTHLASSLSTSDVPEATRLTNNNDDEWKPVQATINGTSYVAWISENASSKKRAIQLQVADGSSEARTLVAADAGYNPTRLALAQLGKTRGALAFVSENVNAGVWLLALDDNAAAAGSVVAMTRQVSTGNTVDLATREEDGGAIIYSASVGDSRDVRFRRLDDEANVLSEEVKVAAGTIQAQDASLARLGGGYVVAFRTLPTAAQPQSQVRLTFVTKEGNLQRDAAGRLISYLVADAGVGGGRVSVRVSTDGQLLIGFLDAEAQALRLFRKRLDCAL